MSCIGELHSCRYFPRYHWRSCWSSLLEERRRRTSPKQRALERAPSSHRLSGSPRRHLSAPPPPAAPLAARYSPARSTPPLRPLSPREAQQAPDRPPDPRGVCLRPERCPRRHTHAPAYRVAASPVRLLPVLGFPLSAASPRARAAAPSAR